MSDDPASATRNPVDAQYLGPPTIRQAQVELMDEAECLRLIAGGGVGRIAYSGEYGLTVLPVSYKLLDGSIVVRTPLGSSTDEALRTGIRGADYRIAFEIDQVGHDGKKTGLLPFRAPRIMWTPTTTACQPGCQDSDHPSGTAESTSCGSRPA